MIKLIKLVEVAGRYTLDDLMVNPANVSTLERNNVTTRLLSENAAVFPTGLSPNASFSTLVADGRSYTVVGTPSEINQKLGNKQLLKG